MFVRTIDGTATRVDGMRVCTIFSGQPDCRAATVVRMKHVVVPDSDSDPFGERAVCSFEARARVLGGIFEFESNDGALLGLVDCVYPGLPEHSFGGELPRFRIRLLLSDAQAARSYEEAPVVRLHSGPGFLCGIMDDSNFAIVLPEQRTASIAVSRSMLRLAHAVRYELIEFAVYTLASRAQQLVSMHAACVGCDGRGLLLIGEGGAGKSTLALQCLLQDMELIAEDAVLVEPDTLLATGIGSFLHLREDGLEFLRPTGDDEWIRRSPVIRRRSGVKKFEIDLRGGRYRLAQAPLRIAAVVILSSARASERGPLLTALPDSELLDRLEASQPYAASQPVWAPFREHISGVPAFELRRGQHPSEAADALRRIISDARCDIRR